MDRLQLDAMKLALRSGLDKLEAVNGELRIVLCVQQRALQGMTLFRRRTCSRSAANRGRGMECRFDERHEEHGGALRGVVET
jgi:hypothetical protein